MLTRLILARRGHGTASTLHSYTRGHARVQTQGDVLSTAAVTAK